MTRGEVMGQGPLTPAPLPLPGPCLQGLTCPVCPLRSVSLPHHRDIIRNCAVSVDQIQDLHSPMSPISENPASPAYSTGRHCPSIPLGTVGTWVRLGLAGTWGEDGAGCKDKPPRRSLQVKPHPALHSKENCHGGGLELRTGPQLRRRAAVPGQQGVPAVLHPWSLCMCASPGSDNRVSLLPAVTRLKPHACQAPGIAPASPVIRRSSEPQLCPGNSSKPLPDPAHSTHSTPCHGYARASPSPSVNSYSDPDTGHYCQLHPTSPISRDRPAHDIKQLPTKSYVERLKVEEGQRGTMENSSGEAEAGQRLKGELDFMGFVPPTMETTSSFNPAAFQSLLIPLENKPLEMAVLKKVKELLAEVDVKTLAKHITKVDCLVRPGPGGRDGHCCAPMLWVGRGPGHP